MEIACSVNVGWEMIKDVKKELRVIKKSYDGYLRLDTKEKLGKYECEIFEVENSIGIKNPFSISDRPNRFCHMKN